MLNGLFWILRLGAKGVIYLSAMAPGKRCTSASGNGVTTVSLMQALSHLHLRDYALIAGLCRFW